MKRKIKELEEKLLRKEQECERLKHDNDYEVGALEKTVDNLKAECERWRNCSDGWMSKYEQEAKLREFISEQLNQLKAENEKYKQALTEIKEVIEICKCHNADGCYECKYFDDCEVEGEEIPTRDVSKLILRKISEVEND